MTLGQSPARPFAGDDVELIQVREQLLSGLQLGCCLHNALVPPSPDQGVCAETCCWPLPALSLRTAQLALRFGGLGLGSAPASRSCMGHPGVTRCHALAPAAAERLLHAVQGHVPWPAARIRRVIRRAIPPESSVSRSGERACPCRSPPARATVVAGSTLSGPPRAACAPAARVAA